MTYLWKLHYGDGAIIAEGTAATADAAENAVAKAADALPAGTIHWTEVMHADGDHLHHRAELPKRKA